MTNTIGDLAVAAPAAQPKPKRLTSDGSWKFAPCFAPDGRSILFCAHHKPNLVSLVRLKLEDGSRELVFPSMTDHQYDPALAPDGTALAFAMAATSPQLVLVLRDLGEGINKHKEVQFRPRDARATARTPRFTPDGRRIVFTLSDGAGQQIASVDRAGKDLKLLTRSTGINCWPSLSPDGRIVFASSRQGHFQLHTMEADGSGVLRVSDSPFRDMRPAWSPSGRWLAWTGTRDGRQSIFLMQPDGTQRTQLPEQGDRDDFAAWAPDSKRLVTVSEHAGNYDLFEHSVPTEG
jgi:TolB protein